MNYEELLKLADEYATVDLKEILGIQLHSAYGSRVAIPEEKLICHLKWMCENISRVPTEVAFLWMGYIQGEFRALGIRTINKLGNYYVTSV